jgi:hypothetical protein
MKIPKQFQLAGQTIDVVPISGLVAHSCHLGEAVYQEAKIKLHVGGVPPSVLEQNFCHEAVHFMLYILGYEELNSNEQFVDSFAHMMHQFITSQKGTIDVAGSGN